MLAFKAVFFGGLHIQLKVLLGIDSIILCTIF